jgi:hypothetical protein
MAAVGSGSDESRFDYRSSETLEWYEFAGDVGEDFCFLFVGLVASAGLP